MTRSAGKKLMHEIGLELGKSALICARYKLSFCLIVTNLRPSCQQIEIQSLLGFWGFGVLGFWIIFCLFYNVLVFGYSKTKTL